MGPSRVHSAESKKSTLIVSLSSRAHDHPVGTDQHRPRDLHTIPRTISAHGHYVWTLFYLPEHKYNEILRYCAISLPLLDGQNSFISIKRQIV